MTDSLNGLLSKPLLKLAVYDQNSLLQLSIVWVIQQIVNITFTDLTFLRFSKVEPTLELTVNIQSYRKK